MKLKLWFNSGANIHSKNVQKADTEKDFGLTTEEWEALSEEDKHDMVLEWWWGSGQIDFGWKEEE